MYSTFCSNNHSNHKNIARNTKTYKTSEAKNISTQELKQTDNAMAKIRTNNKKSKQHFEKKKTNRKLKNDQHEPHYHSISCLHM